MEVILLVGVLYLLWTGKAGNAFRFMADKADAATTKINEFKAQHGSPLK